MLYGSFLLASYFTRGNVCISMLLSPFVTLSPSPSMSTILLVFQHNFATSREQILLDFRLGKAAETCFAVQHALILQGLQVHLKKETFSVVVGRNVPCISITLCVNLAQIICIC